MFKGKYYWIPICLVSVLLVGLLSGCSKGQQQTAQNGPKVIKVAWLSYNLNDDWFQSTLAFAKIEAARIEKRDNVKFEFIPYDGGTKEETQLSQVDNIITKHEADMVYVEPINEKAMANAITKINQQMNVPIGAAGITASGGKYLYVGLDNVAVNKGVGDYLIKLLTQKYGPPANWAKAGGVIVEILGPAGLKISQDRSVGFHQALDPIVAANPGVQVVQVTSNWDTATAFKVMTDAVQRYGNKIIGVYSSSDRPATMGAYKAFSNAGMGYPVGDPKHIPIVTYDGTVSGMQNVRDKTIDMIAEQPAEGYSYLVMEYLYQWYKSGYDSLPKAGTTLTADQLKQQFNWDETTGVQFWAPVKVVPGLNWDGIWMQPQSPVIPDQVSPTEKFEWGNYLSRDNNGKYPWEAGYIPKG